MNLISQQHPLAYFCAEFGLENDLPLYAGGLGILAGDTVKEAGDQNFPLIGVGLLYRGTKARQVLTADGTQIETDLEVKPEDVGLEPVFIPHEDQPLFIRVHLTKVDVWARVWKKTYGTATVYFLDTHTDQNEAAEQDITDALYYGTEAQIIKQQMILGIGGVKLLDALEIHPALYHVNEGRPAFLFWQLIRRLMDKQGLSYDLAFIEAKKMVVYTNHTLVRAGNQDYDTDLITEYGQYYAERMGISLEKLLSPGIEETTHKFNITAFALNTSSRASAVSQPHFELSRSLWPEFTWVCATNGVHLRTWQDSEIAAVDLSGDDIWHIHSKKKQELMEFVQHRSGYGYDPTRLVVVWARRITGYKRLQTVFDDVDALAEIVKDEKKPIQLLIAGKAHINDTASKQIIKDAIASMQGQLSGHAIFIPNYDIEAAKYLTKGADVWLNTPLQNQEACGTSGMKAISNGVLQLTVADGWAAEVDWRDLGWTLDPTHLAETVYFRLKQDIAPLFYYHNARGVPEQWVERMKRSILLSQKYSTTRMLNDYQQYLYEGFGSDSGEKNGLA